MDKVPQLGKLITTEQERDAIHIAVCPVTAGKDLKPGEHIGLIGDDFVVGPSVNNIGVVDPFLTEDVKVGQCFYMFLYPGTITGLRHEWTHPMFEAERTW